MISRRSGWPARTWVRRASFIAESIASEPEPAKKTRASGVEVSDTMRSASCSAGALVNGSKQEYVSIVRICSATASAISARPWPMLQYHRLAIASINSLPSLSHEQRSLAAGDRDEIPPGRLGERVQKGVGHPSIKPQILSASCAGRTDALRISGCCRVWQGGGVTTRTDPFTEAASRVAHGADHHAEAEALVAQLSLEEKLGCLDGDSPFWPGLTDLSGGGGYYLHPWPAAVVERLGIPGIQFADGPRGCVIGDATAFPVSMARGATFDPDLEERIGEAIGAELRASGATFTGAVCMNLLRHPAWGRAQETYGEDPHHVGVMAAALTRGLQRHVMACMKHFALNSMENARFTVDVTVGERALHEVYLPHFERVAAEGVASVMSAYNSVNGEWAGQNATLLTDILRREWGWDGFVISDFIFGLRDAVESVGAGLDIEMPFRQQRALALGDAVARGDLDVTVVDRAVGRIVATLLRFAPQIAARPPLEVVGSDAHRALAFDTAVRATVLLRNESELLPIDPSTTGRVAVLGRLAGAAQSRRRWFERRPIVVGRHCVGWPACRVR